MVTRVSLTLGISCEGCHREQAPMSPTPLPPHSVLVPTPKKNIKNQFLRNGPRLKAKASSYGGERGEGPISYLSTVLSLPADISSPADAPFLRYRPQYLRVIEPRGTER